jgi:type II secretory pathway pseudopilin PulG
MSRMPGTVAKARPGRGFGPVPFGYIVLIELMLVISIIGIAAALQLREFRLAAFKAAFGEVLVAIGTARHDVSERISLTGRWDAPQEGADEGRTRIVTVAPTLSLKGAEQELRQHGGTPFAEAKSRYVNGIFRLGASYVVLVNHEALPGAGVVSFRPAVPDVAQPATVFLHCGPGRPPKGWVAPPDQVPGNLPPSTSPGCAAARSVNQVERERGIAWLTTIRNSVTRRARFFSAAWPRGCARGMSLGLRSNCSVKMTSTRALRASRARWRVIAQANRSRKAWRK